MSAIWMPGAFGGATPTPPPEEFYFVWEDDTGPVNGPATSIILWENDDNMLNENG